MTPVRRAAATLRSLVAHLREVIAELRDPRAIRRCRLMAARSEREASTLDAIARLRRCRRAPARAQRRTKTPEGSSATAIPPRPSASSLGARTGARRSR